MSTKKDALDDAETGAFRDDTAHLLSDPVNAAYLLQSIAEANAGLFVERQLLDYADTPGLPATASTERCDP